MSDVVGAIVSDPAELARLEPEWWELWRRTPSATPFVSPAWCLPWWDAFAAGKPLATLAIRIDGRLAGLAPAWIDDGPYGVRLLPIGIGITDYLDVLIDPAEAEAAGSELARLAGTLPGWESWDLEQLTGCAAAFGVPCPEGCAELNADQGACPVLDLSGPDDPVPSRKRRKLRMAEHRFERRGGEVRTVEPGEAGRFLDDLVRLHTARWTERGEGGVLRDPAVVRFHRAALPGLFEAGVARLYEAVVADRVVGSFYGLGDATRVHAYIGGFDPDYAFESPGTVLMGHAIARARAEGAREFHFLRGQEPYKYEWGATDRWNRHRSFRREPA
jgi:CelD/BcsL family acetyltransferase involved in cellulose biosynthesis